MLIHPWDGAISETEWRDWLAAGHDFGQLAVNDPVGFQKSAWPMSCSDEPKVSCGA
jgi:transcriptional regulator